MFQSAAAELLRSRMLAMSRDLRDNDRFSLMKEAALAGKGLPAALRYGVRKHSLSLSSQYIGCYRSGD